MEAKPLLIFRQLGRGRAPRLAPLNATASNQLPIPLFPFPSELVCFEPREELDMSDLGPSCRAVEERYTSPCEGPLSSLIAEDVPDDSSIQKQQSQRDSSDHESASDEELPSANGEARGKQKRKRVTEHAPPCKKTRVQDRRNSTSRQECEKKSSKPERTLPTPMSSMSPTAPSFSPLTPVSNSSLNLPEEIPFKLPTDLHEDPHHYDPHDHNLTSEATRLRLWNWPLRNKADDSASEYSEQEVTLKRK